MKKTLTYGIFNNAPELIRFVSENAIDRNDIVSISTNRVGDQILYYYAL